MKKIWKATTTYGLVSASQFLDEIIVIALFGSRSLSWNQVIITLGHRAVTLGCVIPKLDLISVNLKYKRYTCLRL